MFDFLQFSNHLCCIRLLLEIALYKFEINLALIGIDIIEYLNYKTLQLILQWQNKKKETKNILYQIEIVLIIILS